MEERKTANDFDPDLLILFDAYVHGAIDRRGFLDKAAKYAVGGVTAAALLDALNPKFAEAQQVTVTLGDQTIDTFTIQPKEELIRKPTITAAQLGTADVVELKIAVDKTYVPAVITNGANRDPRELGVRVFHAYIQPKS